MSKLSSKFVNFLSRIKIKQSLIYTFLFVFFIPFTIIYSLFIVGLYKTIKNWELTNAQNKLEIVKKDFSNIIDDVDLFSDNLVSNKTLHKILSSNYNDNSFMDSGSLFFLDDNLKGNKEIKSIRIFTENQTISENPYIYKVSPNIKNSDWYTLAANTNGEVFWNYREDIISKETYLCLIRSIWTEEEEFLGVLVININSQCFDQIIIDPLLKTFIVFDYKLIFSSSNSNLEEEEQQMVKIIYRDDYTNSDIVYMTINDEKIGVVALDYCLEGFNSQKFEILNIIPVTQLISLTRKMIIHSCFVMIIILVLIVGVLLLYSVYIDNRVQKINTEVDQIVENNFKIADSIGGNDEFEQIYKTIKNMSINIDDLINKLYINTEEKNKLALQQSEISFKMLSNQINPHFLFNTLETIRMKALAASDKEVATMLKLLAQLLRYNLSVKGQAVPLIKEVESIQNYLSIQHMRFGERVSYDIDTMCDIQNFEILPLIIQPIVENSFHHGLENKLSGGFIYILITTVQSGDETHLQIKVKDNGCGIEEEKLEEINQKLADYKNQDTSTSIGLINVQSRIKMFYGENSGLSVESDIGEGTTVTILI